MTRSYRSRAACLALPLFFALALATPALARGDHKDERLGYRIRFPKDFNQIPIQAGEQWVVAKFQSDERTSWTGGVGDWTYYHTPEVQVIAFLEELIFRDDTEQNVEQEEEFAVGGQGGGDAGGGDGGTGGPPGGGPGGNDPPPPTVKKVEKARVEPYRDYLDYMRRTYTAGGWYVAAEDTRRVKGMDVTCYTIAVEKPDNGGPRHIETWVYETPLGQIAVQAEMFANAWDDLERPIEQMLRSFASIERTEDLALDALTGPSTPGADSHLDPAERARRRVTAEEQDWKLAVSSLPDGWDAYEIDGVRVLNHVDKKLASKMVDRVNATWKCLDETFPEIGPEEYARKPTLRICKDRDEERAFRQGRGGLNWGGMGLEIVTRKDNYAGSNSNEWDWISRRTLEVWFEEHDYDLYYGMPEWLKYGLERLFSAADVKAGKLRFKEASWEKKWLRDARRDGGLLTAAELMQLTDGRIAQYRRKNNWAPPAQLIVLARLLIGTPGRSSPHREMLGKYLEHVREVAAVQRAEQEAAEAAETEPETEEEEEKRIRARASQRRKRERKLLEEAFARTFAEWSERDWKKFESSFEREMR